MEVDIQSIKLKDGRIIEAGKDYYMFHISKCFPEERVGFCDKCQRAIMGSVKKIQKSITHISIEFFVVECNELMIKGKLGNGSKTCLYSGDILSDLYETHEKAIAAADLQIKELLVREPGLKDWEIVAENF